VDRVEPKHAQRRDQGQQESPPIDAQDVAERRHVDEGDRRPDQDGPERRHRHVAQRLGEEQQDDGDRGRRHEGGQLRASAGGVAGHGARVSAGDRKALRERSRELRRGESHQLAVDVDLVAVLRRERARGHDRRGEADECHRRRCAEQWAELVQREQRQVEGREAGGYVADDGDSPAGRDRRLPRAAGEDHQ
jgi:hypothetical protein